jgi:catechol 2,3-dioxygenase-like lactoylglutathione lyase family enzyme
VQGSGKEKPMDCTDLVTFLYTADLERADDFYRGKLGLSLAVDQGRCRIYRVGPNAYLGLCRATPGREPCSTGVIITFVTEDVEERHAELRGRGVTFESGPERNLEYNITHCFLRDPDGHLLEIQRFEDSGWQAGKPDS